MKLGAICRHLDATLLHADAEVDVRCLNTLERASGDEISFLANAKYHQQVRDTQAVAVIVSSDVAANLQQQLPIQGLIVVQGDPYLAFARVQRLFHPQPETTGLRHPHAIIDNTAVLADDVDVAAGAVIEAGVHIGQGSRIGANCVLEKNAEIGSDCQLCSGSMVAAGCVLKNRVILQPGAVIGSDGFGYAWSGSEHLKIPQAGRVVLEDDVEIGANTCVDRGALGDTVIRRGVKLDNLIQIAHNVEVGAFTVMASQVGISGSTKIGAGCQIGGQTGMAGHLTVGDGCKLAAKTGVTSNLAAGQTYAGFPAMPHKTWLKMSVLLTKLPDIWKKLKTLG